LEEGAEPPKQVAAHCGFAEPDTLRRAFRRQMGVTQRRSIESTIARNPDAGAVAKVGGVAILSRSEARQGPTNAISFPRRILGKREESHENPI
jgi:AraC-like DNA-binding protein